MEVPEELSEKLADFDTKEDEIEQQFADGDLTADARRKALRSLSKEREEVNQEIIELKMEARVKQRDIEKENQAWLLEQSAFNKANADLYRQFEEDG